MNSLFKGVLFFSIFLFSCQSKPDLETEKATIRALLQNEREAHFSRNADQFISEFAEGMISVNNGEVMVPTREQHLERIGKYFGSVEFIRWDDTAEPIIRFSEDASLAYAVIQKQVILKYPDSFGNNFTDTTDYAWVSVFRKQKGQWKVECNISTKK